MTKTRKEELKPSSQALEAGAHEVKEFRLVKSRWLLSLFLLAALVLVAIVAIWLFGDRRITSRIEGHIASQPYPEFAIGDLGGMPVKMPQHLAELLEYDGDPGWAPAPNWRPPVRSFESKINSFGFYVRYPDGQTLDSWQRREERRLTPPWEDRWISVGVQSGSRYTRHGFLQRYERSILDSKSQKSALFRYHPQAQKEFGLEVYKLAPPPEGPDPMQSIVHEEHFGRDSDGTLITTIDCTAVKADPNNSTCKQQWSLESWNLSVRVTAQYRRPLLQHWREIQPMVTQIVLGFRHDPRKPEEAPSAPR